jgi:WD40 repeat protein
VKSGLFQTSCIILALGPLFLLADCGNSSNVEPVCKIPNQQANQQLVFSPDAQHIAWISRSLQRCIVNVDGVADNTYDYIHSGIVFSPDSRHHAYGAERSGKQFLVVDNKETVCDRRPENITFSPDSTEIAYAVKTNLTGNGTAWTVFIDGATGRKIFLAMWNEFAFSPDGKHFAYCAGTDWNHQTLIVDGITQKIPLRVVKSLELSHDGKHIAYRSGGVTGEVCVFDDVVLKEHQQIWASGFSPDGSKFAFVGLDNLSNHERWVPLQFELNVNGAVVGACTIDGFPALSDDGSHMAYLRPQDPLQSDSPRCVVADGINQPFYWAIGQPSFSPDGKHLVYAVEQEKYSGTAPSGSASQNSFIVLDGVPQRRYSRTYHPVFSSDNEHVAYCAYHDNHAHLVIDELESAPFDMWLSGSPVRFDLPTRAHCLGIQAGMIVRVTMDAR